MPRTSATSVFIALLRAVNVGGTGKLPMTELTALCEEAGFTDVRTYIASGNVVFRARGKEAAVKAALERALEKHMGKAVGVMVRSAEEIAAVLAANPFAAEAGNRVVAIFLDDAPPVDAITAATGKTVERLVTGTREIYVHYGEGMADSKLRIPAAKQGTARNMNTVAKLVAMTRGPAR